MKRSAPQRRTGLKRTGKLKPVNPVRQAKKRKRQASKHAKYMRSETRKLVEARSGRRCEAAVGSSMLRLLDVRPPTLLWQHGIVGWSNSVGSWFRCENRATDHHHLTYARYGGDELPEDMLHVCKRCHQWLDKDKPSASRRPTTRNQA